MTVKNGLSSKLYDITEQLEACAQSDKMKQDEHALRLSQAILAQLYRLARWVKEHE